jgi:uncharacterized membrane protein (DUF2068 family)
MEETKSRPLGLVLIVVYKAVWGMLELAAGGLITKSATLRGELTDDPQDQLAAWLLAHWNLQPAQLRAMSAALLALGLVKLVLALGIWYRSWFIRDVALVTMGIAGVFALGALVVDFSLFRLAVVGTDLLIVLYLWRILPRYLPPRESRVDAEAGATLTR